MFEFVQELCERDLDFGEIWEKCIRKEPRGLFLMDKVSKDTCASHKAQASIRELVIRELHDGGLGGQFGQIKSVAYAKSQRAQSKIHDFTCLYRYRLFGSTSLWILWWAYLEHKEEQMW